MGEREQFLKEYQEQVLDTLTLPPEWSVRYTVQSCLKDGERQVYLLRDQAGRAGGAEDTAGRGGRTPCARSMTCCGSSITARFLAHWTIWSGRGGSTWSGNM